MFRSRLVICSLLSLLMGGMASAQQPLLQYTFDEPSGDALDSGSAPLTDAVLSGGASRSTDTPNGTGFSLDLRDDASTYAYALSGDADDLDGLSALTLTTWLKLESYPSGNNRLLSKQAAGSFDGFSFNMNAAPNDGPVGPDNFRLGLFLGGDGSFTFGFSNADASATDWAFLAATYDTASNTIAFYMGDRNTPVALLGTPQVLTTNPGVIDGMSALFGVGYTDAASTSDTSAIGWQDDVRVYGSALNLSQLEEVRKQGIPEPSSCILLLIAAAATCLFRRR